jgi:hypothetical protein
MLLQVLFDKPQVNVSSYLCIYLKTRGCALKRRTITVEVPDGIIPAGP